MITVHGLMGAPSERLLADAARADAVVGGRRHLDALGVPDERRIVLGSLDAALERLAALGCDADIVVVASGDPLYFGIVRRLRAAGLRPRVVPAVSSVAATFAAVGLPWDDAVVVSAHARPLTAAVALARAHPKVAVFTSREHSIAAIASALGDLDRTFVLAERLGEADERVRVLTGPQARAVVPLEPNVVLVLDRHPDDPDPAWDGLVAGPAPTNGAA